MDAREIMVVGPDVDRREELVAALRRAGYKALGVSRLSDAIGATTEATPDVLAIDLHDPELDLPRLGRALAPGHSPEPETLDDMERRHIAAMLKYTGGNRRRTALLLGISRSTLLNKIRRYGLEVPPRSSPS
jgi:DNA-binding NtrC family response regulator